MRIQRLKQGRDLAAAVGAIAVLAAAADMFRDTTGLSSNPVYLVHTLGYMAFFCVLFVGGDRLVVRFIARRASGPAVALPGSADLLDRLCDMAFSAVPQTYSLGGALRLGTLIYACWSPLLVLMFPGVIWWDTRQQLLQYNGLPNALSEGVVTDHHPVLDTYIYGWFTDMGRALGSADAGVYVFCLLQAFAAACSLACCVIMVRRLGGGRGICTPLLAFLCLYWHLPLYASAMAKDSTFLPFFLLFSVASIEVARLGGRILESPCRVVAYGAPALLMALTRKTGLIIVVIVLTAVCLKVMGRRCKVAVAGTAAALVLIMAVIMPAVVLPALGCEPGGKQEAYGLMFQQSALLMRDHGDELPLWQRKEIEKAIGKDGADNYAWFLTDSVKDPMRGAADDLDFPSYLRAWAAGLLMHPICYLQAFLGVETGWFGMPEAGDSEPTPYLTPVDGHNVSHVFPRSSDLGLTWSDTSLGRAVESIITWFQSTPVGMLVGAKALWSTWGMVFLLLEVKRHAPGSMYLLTPLVAANLVLWISPTSYTTESMRYLLPLLFWLPVSAAAALASFKDKPIR